MKRTPFKRRRTPLPYRSTKMAAYYAKVRMPAVRAAVGDGRNPCQARTPVCTRFVQGIHEVLPRGRAGGLKASLRDGPTLDVCHACNDWISLNPREAKQMGLLRSSGEEVSG